MACDCRSMLHSGRSTIDMCLWILVMTIPASSGGFSVNTEKIDSTIQADPNEEAHSINVDMAIFDSSTPRELNLTTSSLSKPVVSVAEEISKSFESETKFNLTPSFQLLEKDVPSQRFENHINSNIYLSMSISTTLVDSEIFNKSNREYKTQQVLFVAKKGLAVENTHSNMIASRAILGRDTHVKSTTAIVQFDKKPATTQMKLSTDTSTEMYSATDFISSSLSTTLQEEAATMSSMMENITPVLSIDVSSAIEVSPSKTSEATVSPLLSANSSEQYHINTRVVNTTQITSNSLSLHPSDHALSLLGNFSIPRTLSISYNGNTTELDPSLAGTRVDTDIILSNQGTTLLANTSDQIRSDGHANETYNVSAETTGSFVDISSGLEFTGRFESNSAVSSLAQLFSDLIIYPSGNDSEITLSFIVDYPPFSSTAFDNTMNEMPPNTSNWRATSLPSGPPPEQTYSTLVGVSANIVGSTVIPNAWSSSATDFFFQPQTTDTKEWAVPVTACLSAALLIAVVVIAVTCHRSKSGHPHRGRRDDTATVHTKQEQRQTGNTTIQSLSEVPPRYKQQKHTKVLWKPRGDQNRVVGQRVVIHEIKPDVQSNIATCANDGKEIFELDSMAASARENVYVQQNVKYNQEQCSSDSEDLIYDDPTFIQDNPDSRYGVTERIQSSPQSVNQPGTHTHKPPVTFNKIQQKEFETSVTFNRMSQDEPKTKTRSMHSKETFIQTADSSDSRVNYINRIHHQQDPHETTQLGYSVSSDGYISDEYKDEPCWEDWDDRTHTEGERDVASRNRNSANSQDSESTSGFTQNPLALASERAKHRPGMYKCVSFDGTQLRMTENMFNVVSKDKSPTRKISTISESALTYLAVPLEGFVSMSSSAYETVDDLSEVGSPNSSSRVFIGSYPKQIHNAGRDKKSTRRNLHSSTENSVDINKETAAGIAINEVAEQVPEAKTNQDSEKQQTKPEDDYIFPIVRKAKLKILEERKNKKLASETSSSQDNVVMTSEHLWRHSTSGETDMKNKESEMTVNEANPLQPPGDPAAVVMQPLHRKPHMSNIPTIVLTKEEDENMVDSERQNNMPHNAEVKPAPVRRIARANNPFLIEVDTLSVSEKVRRSSAPSMTPSSESTPDAGSRVGMVRSASNDHLSSYNRANRLEPRPLRPWSSEFFDMIMNSDGYSKDVRFKKMIDDRYDALFNQKHPHSAARSRHDDRSFQQDLPTRIWKLLTSSSHNSLPRDLQGNIGYFSNREADDTESLSTLNPILNIRKSEQSYLFINETDRFNRERHPAWHYPELQLGIPRGNQTSTDNIAAVKSRTYVTPMSPNTDNVDARTAPFLGSQSPRPNLARGTDGIDSDIGIEERASLANRSTNANHDNNKLSQLKSSESNVSNSNKLIHAKQQWESFEEDFEVERLLVDSRLPSDKALIPDKRRSPNNQTLKSSEFPSHETSNKTPMRHGNSLHQQLTEAKRAVSATTQIGVDSFKKSEHTKISTPFSERNPSVIPDSAVHHHHDEVSSSNQNNQETFEDNFCIDIVNINQQPQGLVHIMSNTKITSDMPQCAHLESQQKQNMQRGPEIPPRKARRKGPRAPRLTRPPSPFLSSKGLNSQSVTCQEENDSLESKTNKTEAIVGNEGDHYDGSHRRRRSFSTERYNSSDSISISSTLGRMQQRSLSLNEKPSTEMARPQRAVTLETDQPSSHFTWSHLRFMSSANNTVLQHDNSLDVLNDSISLSEAEMELYFGSSVFSPSLPEQHKEESSFKALFFSNSLDFETRVSSV